MIASVQGRIEASARSEFPTPFSFGLVFSVIFTPEHVLLDSNGMFRYPAAAATLRPIM